MRSKVLTVVLGAILASSIVALFHQQPVLADSSLTLSVPTSISETYKKAALNSVLETCYGNRGVQGNSNGSNGYLHNNGNPTAAQVGKGDWFDTGSNTFSDYDGLITRKYVLNWTASTSLWCDSFNSANTTGVGVGLLSGVVTKTFGWTSLTQGACALGMVRKDGSDCVNSSSGADFKRGDAGYKSQVGSVSPIWSNPEGEYVKAAMVCGGDIQVVDYNSYATNPDTKSQMSDSNVLYVVVLTTDSSHNVIISHNVVKGYMTTEGGNTYASYASCTGSLSQKNATAFNSWLSAHQKSLKDSVTVSESTAAITKATTDGSNGQTSCTVEGIGWIVCPVMNFMAGVNDVLYNALQGMLAVSPTIFTSDTNKDSSSDLYSAWNAFRGYANILFIIVFLIVIYSQITSVGITNYGVKKLLPKLIIAAILVNTSYYICQIAVDISNILGVGLKALFTSIGAGISTSGSDSSWLSFVGGALTVGAAVAGGVALLLAVSVPVVLAALLSLLMVVVILIVRQAIVILLIAISPLAFIAWLLPNTEKWFKKWWDLFFSMLMLFPIISALFGAGALASKILATGDFGNDGGVAKLAALGAAVLPLIATIPLLQGSLKATGALGAKLSGFSQKANSRVSKAAGESRLGDWNKYRKEQVALRSAKARAGLPTPRVGGKLNPANWVNGTAAGLNRVTNRILPEDVTSGYANRADSLRDAEFNEKVKAAAVGYSERSSGDVLKDYRSGKLNDTQQAAAIEHIMAKGSFNERRALVESIRPEMSGKLKKRISDGVYGKGDQNIYGASIGAKIMAGNIGGEAGLRQTTLSNIEEGHVNADHLVQGEGSAGYLVDVATGKDNQLDAAGSVVKDAAGNPIKVTASVSGSETASTELKSAITEAQTNTRTKAQANATAFSKEFGRIP